MKKTQNNKKQIPVELVQMVEKKSSIFLKEQRGRFLFFFENFFNDPPLEFIVNFLEEYRGTGQTIREFEDFINNLSESYNNKVDLNSFRIDTKSFYKEVRHLFFKKFEEYDSVINLNQDTFVELLQVLDKIARKGDDYLSKDEIMTVIDSIDNEVDWDDCVHFFREFKDLEPIKYLMSNDPDFINQIIIMFIKKGILREIEDSREEIVSIFENISNREPFVEVGIQSILESSGVYLVDDLYSFLEMFKEKTFSKKEVSDLLEKIFTILFEGDLIDLSYWELLIDYEKALKLFSSRMR